MSENYCHKGGKRFRDEMDAKIALAEGLRLGRRASGYYFCDRCAGYHLGPAQRLKKQVKCWATAKVCYPNKRSADDYIERSQRRGRDESRAYLCEKYCQQWHTTSMTSKVPQ